MRAQGVQTQSFRATRQQRETYGAVSFGLPNGPTRSAIPDIGRIEIPQRSGRLAHRMRYIEATRRRTTSAVMGG